MVSSDSGRAHSPDHGRFVTRLRAWLAASLITGFGEAPLSKTHNNQYLAACLLVFLLALGVRLLTWHDLRLDIWKVQTYVTSDYKYSADLLARGEFKPFLHDINRMGHPPGYPLVLAGIYEVYGNSDDAIQLLQIVGDSIAAVLVFLIVFELLPFGVALIAGLLTALSPQFAYHSVLLLPDSLAVLPILLAVYFSVRGLKRPAFLPFVLAGALIGISCWLRANALLLAPFLAICLALISERGVRLRFAGALLAGTIAIVAPITVKNWVVFGHFVPLSLGAGQTLLEGIADYDTEKQLNIPETDLGIMRQEAELYQRPEYALVLFGEDGIKRERRRLSRGFAVIRSRPLWFLSVMARRAISSTRLDPVPPVAASAPVTQPFKTADNLQPIWTHSPQELIADSVGSKSMTVELSDENRMLRIVGDETKYGNQIVSPPITVAPNRDYLFRVPLKLEEGRALLKSTGLDSNVAQHEALAASVIDLVEGEAPSNQPLRRIDLPFVSGDQSQVRFVLANNASAPAHLVARMGAIELYELGPSSYQWTRFPRFLIRNLQRFFLTAWMLPLTILGLVALIGAKRRRTWLLLLSVPLYYLLVQSALHTERRYVIVIHYFFTMLAAVFLGLLLKAAKEGFRKLILRDRATQSPTPE